MAKDRRVTTWESKLVVYDYDSIQSASEGESEYLVLCIHPDARALLLTALNFYAEYKSRWVNFPDETTRLDLIARTNGALISEMACSEDIQALITAVSNIGQNIGDMSTNVQLDLQDLEAQLVIMNTKLDNLETTVAAMSPFIDQSETIFNNIASILGGVVAVLP